MEPVIRWNEKFDLAVAVALNAALLRHLIKLYSNQVI